MRHTGIPRVRDLYSPIVDALKSLGGEGPRSIVKRRVAEMFSLTPEQMDMRVENPKYKEKKLFDHRLDSAKMRLEVKGVITSPERGYWVLTESDTDTFNVGLVESRRTTPRPFVNESQDEKSGANRKTGQSRLKVTESWREELAAILKQMDPFAFERLSERILRESGFTQVDVTGRSGDGGIDGIGILQPGGLMSIRVLFQCKRWNGTIAPGTLRDFRGAMIGRTDKGLFVTTGNFTPAAVREATRDGAPEIDLIDGEQLIDKLKELSLGVSTKEVIVEEVTVDPDFFANM